MSDALDLEAIKAQYDDAVSRFGNHGAIEDLNRANALANHVPTLIAEVERLNEWLKTTQECAAQRVKDAGESTADLIGRLIDENEALRASIRDCSGSCHV